MLPIQHQTVTWYLPNQVEIRYTFVGPYWTEARFERGRLRQDGGRLSLRDVMEMIGHKPILRDEVISMDPLGAEALTPT